MRCWQIMVVCLALQAAPVAAGDASLIDAAAAGDIETVRRQLEQGVPIESRSHNGKTALIAASQHGHTEIVKLLLAKGAVLNARTQSGSTAFYYAAQNHHVPVLTLLHANGADVNTVNRNGFSALSVAVVNGDEAVVRLLLGVGASTHIQSGAGPLLIEALGRGHAGIFQALLDVGADVNATVAGSGAQPR